MALKPIAIPVNKLLIAAVTASFVWHLMSLFMFQLVFTVDMQSDSPIDNIEPVVLTHETPFAGRIAGSATREMLEALSIKLPAKQPSGDTAMLSSDYESAMLGRDKLDLVSKMDPFSDLGSARDLPKPGSGALVPGVDSEATIPLNAFGGSISGPAAKRVIIFQPLPPQYPHEAELKGVEGDVTISFLVSKDGEVVNTVVVSLSGSALLDQTALDFIRSFKFDRSNEATPGRATLRFRLAKPN
ncbi:MAG: energy transducer TonB [Candidatus Brocadiia bacterium]